MSVRGDALSGGATSGHPLDRYDVLDTIGTGGFAIVKRVRFKASSENFAMKIISVKMDEEVGPRWFCTLARPGELSPAFCRPRRGGGDIEDDAALCIQTGPGRDERGRSFVAEAFGRIPRRRNIRSTQLSEPRVGPKRSRVGPKARERILRTPLQRVLPPSPARYAGLLQSAV